MSAVSEVKDHGNFECDCQQTTNTKDKKPKWKKKLKLFPKSSKKCKEEAADCPICIQTKGYTSRTNPCVEITHYEPKQRPIQEVVPPPIEICNCTKCQRARGEEPLTTELLPLETQVTLQSMMTDTFLMCVVL